MPERTTQTLKNHPRFDPLFHAFVVPVFALTVLLAIFNVIRRPEFAGFWLLLLSIAAVVAVLKIRLYALKAQDRVIRLEERLRLSALLPESSRARISALTEGQLIALRFAPDAEVPALVEKALANSLPPAEIKKQIVNWRADYFRI